MKAYTNIQSKYPQIPSHFVKVYWHCVIFGHLFYDHIQPANKEQSEILKDDLDAWLDEMDAARRRFGIPRDEYETFSGRYSHVPEVLRKMFFYGRPFFPGECIVFLDGLTGKTYVIEWIRYASAIDNFSATTKDLEVLIPRYRYPRRKSRVWKWITKMKYLLRLQ